LIKTKSATSVSGSSSKKIEDQPTIKRFSTPSGLQRTCRNHFTTIENELQVASDEKETTTRGEKFTPFFTNSMKESQ